MSQPLLRIRDLRVQFRTDAGLVRAVDGIDCEVCKVLSVGEEELGAQSCPCNVVKILLEGFLVC